MSETTPETMMNGVPRPQVNKAALTMLVATLVSAMIPLWYWSTATETCRHLVLVLVLLPSVLTAFGAISLIPIPQKPEVLTFGMTVFDFSRTSSSEGMSIR